MGWTICSYNFRTSFSRTLAILARVTKVDREKSPVASAKQVPAMFNIAEEADIPFSSTRRILGKV